MNEQWRKQMQQKLDGHRQAAPMLAWDEVERRAAAGKKLVKGAPWVRRTVAAAAVVVLLCGVGLTLLLLNNGQKASQVANIERQFAPKGDAAAAVADDAAAANVQQGGDFADKAFAHSTALPQHGMRATLLRASTVPADAYTPSPNVEQKGNGMNQTETNAAQNTQQNIPYNTSKNSTDKAPRGQQPTKTQLEQAANGLEGRIVSVVKPARRGTLTANAYVSGGPVALNSNETQRPALVMARAYGASVVDEMRSGEYVQLQDVAPVVETKAHHRQPLRIGASLRYALGKRWSVDAGLAYTRLRSDLTSKAANVEHLSQQTLHYLGVPLNVSYRIVGKRRLHLYASAGVMAEKLVKGKKTSVSKYSGVPTDEETQRVKEKNAQLSVNAALGAEYMIADRLSVFAEPGVSYHFDNGSNISSIYKERPTNFNLNVGLRFCVNR